MTSAVLESLRSAGVLADLPESSQVSFFCPLMQQKIPCQYPAGDFCVVWFSLYASFSIAASGVRYSLQHSSYMREYSLLGLWCIRLLRVWES